MVNSKDELILDTTEFKKIFSNKSLKKVNTFMKNRWWILLLIIPLVLSIYLRTVPERMPIAEDWARDSIENNIRNSITQQINSQRPNLPAETRQQMIEEEYQRTYNELEAQIEAQIPIQADMLRAQFKHDTTGTTYLGDIDSYYWLRYARNIIETGRIGDEYRENVAYDNHMLAPLGKPVQENIYPYIEAIVYRFFRIFSSKFDLIKAGFYTPMVLSFFAIIAAFLIGKKISGNLAGFVASVLIAVNQNILSRSLGSDNDIVNVVFPLLIMLFLFYAFESETKKSLIIFSALTGLLIGVYSFAWSGWWFMFLFIIGATITYVGYNFLFDALNKKNKEKSKLNLKQLTPTIFLLVFIVTSWISLSLFGNGGQFTKAFTNPVDFLKIKSASKGANIWPNVYTTVAELNSANMNQIIASMGSNQFNYGRIFFWLALIGTIVFLVNFDTKGSKKTGIIYLASSAFYFFIYIYVIIPYLLTVLNMADSKSVMLILIFIPVPLIAGLILSAIFGYTVKPKQSILMVIWFVATIFAATKGVRFLLLIVPAFVISLSSFIGQMVDWMSTFFSDLLDISKKTMKIAFILAILVMLYSPIKFGYATSKSYIPSINDGWVQSLEKINAESSESAIINSWWDFGHWFKYWSDRAVTFDGASQNKAQAHWIGKVLLTDNEDDAVAILNMLDCGGDQAAAKLDVITGDTVKTVELIYDLFDMTESKRKNELRKITDEKTADEIYGLMFCEPPEDYFITSQDMVSKAGVWAHFGSWNFQRAKEYYYFTSEQTIEGFIKKVTEEFGYDGDSATRKYYEIASLGKDDRKVNDWIAPWPGYIMQRLNGCSQNEEEIVCGIGVTLQQTNDQRIIAERAIISKEDMSSATIVLGFYTNTNPAQRLGENIVVPSAVYHVKDGNFDRIETENRTFEFDVFLHEKDGIYSSMLMQEKSPLSESMFTRLFYLGGEGTEHFDMFHDVTDVTGSRIITWKIDWEGD